MDGQEFEEIDLNEGVSQRIILVAASFRPEVTSTVLWLMNHNVRLQCFEVVPYAEGDELFLTVEQIIPIRDAEDYMIGMAQKEQEAIASKTRSDNTRAKVKAFWEDLVRAMQDKPSPFQRKFRPRSGSYISVGSGLTGVEFVFAVAPTKFVGRVELYIDWGSSEENKSIFDQFLSQREEIDADFGSPLEWDPLDGDRACKIKIETHGDLDDVDQKQAMIEFMTDAMCRLEAAVRKPLKEVGEKLKHERATRPKS